MASSMAARQAATLLRLSSPRSASQAASHIQRRGLAGAADHHGPPKVDFWKDPMSPSLWKEEHFVIVSLTGWGVLIYGGYKLFSGGKKDELPVDYPAVQSLDDSYLILIILPLTCIKLDQIEWWLTGSMDRLLTRVCFYFSETSGSMKPRI
ncbi:hypothetical protein SSX86_016590 [Deinandra increscens subsp. villosa]|uniref:Uncharacterized protein n=1 Tax=Deinandra increscens subsp. villosa TaxID=3103831 RepID=A0AAP0D3N5_9ASTR